MILSFLVSKNQKIHSKFCAKALFFSLLLSLSLQQSTHYGIDVEQKYISVKNSQRNQKIWKWIKNWIGSNHLLSKNIYYINMIHTH